MQILYLIMAFLATSLGAITGLGGGVIIKPVMDMLGHFDAASISAISTMTVFAMAISSIIKQIIAKTKIDLHVALPMAIGSLIGGNLGQYILTFLAPIIEENILVGTQNLILSIVIIIVFIYMRHKEKIMPLYIRSAIPVFLVGIFLGVSSSFLGIGGGPINIAVLIYVMGYTAKASAIYSIVAILFSQAAKLSGIAFSTGFAGLSLSVAPVMIIAGIVGGLVGSSLNRKLNVKQVEVCFDCMQVCIFILSMYNAVSNFML